MYITLLATLFSLLIDENPENSFMVMVYLLPLWLIILALLPKFQTVAHNYNVNIHLSVYVLVKVEQGTCYQ